jgi:hypothetical protein
MASTPRLRRRVVRRRAPGTLAARISPTHRNQRKDAMDIELNEHGLETKAGVPAGMVTHDDLMRVVTEFQQANDARIAAFERGRGDVLMEEKVARLNSAVDAHQRRLDELALKAARPAFGSAHSAAGLLAAQEHKAAFDAYVRRGDAISLRTLETKAMSVGSDPDGGYLVPEEIEQAIGKRLAAISPIRSIAAVREVSASVYKKPFMTAGPAVGWVGETAARPQTASPTLDELSFPAAELYAMPAATPTLLEDAAVNVDEWRRKSRPPSPNRRARPSSRAMASTSRRAFSPTPRWRTPPGCGARSALSPPASPTTGRRATPLTCWSI